MTGFQYYRCILLVPDIYNRPHIKEVVNMLLLNMGFSGNSKQETTKTNIFTVIFCQSLFRVVKELFNILS